ncbi:MAG: hypothetical protein JSS07_01610 [Proteobacteria bacterium]|nr:hypothetical protein [Pseudomonadota bacterium]
MKKALLLCLAYLSILGCDTAPLYEVLRTKNDNTEYRFIVDRYGYHYYRGPYDADRHYEDPYYNNSGYFNTVDSLTGKSFYYNAYNNYNNGYYKGGFYSNEYYHHGYFNGIYNPGYCRGQACAYKWMK